jgi:putative transposase
MLFNEEIIEKRVFFDDQDYKVYLALFEKELSDYTLEEIRNSVNRSWVLGSKKFKNQVELETGRRVDPSQRGGDRKSESYRVSNH